MERFSCETFDWVHTCVFGAPHFFPSAQTLYVSTHVIENGRTNLLQQLLSGLIVVPVLIATHEHDCACVALTCFRVNNFRRSDRRD